MASFVLLYNPNVDKKIFICFINRSLSFVMHIYGLPYDIEFVPAPSTYQKWALDMFVVYAKQIVCLSVATGFLFCLKHRQMI